MEVSMATYSNHKPPISNSKYYLEMVSDMIYRWLIEVRRPESVRRCRNRRPWSPQNWGVLKEYSMNWCKGQFTGKPHIDSQNRWFLDVSCKFPFIQSIEISITFWVSSHTLIYEYNLYCCGYINLISITMDIKPKDTGGDTGITIPFETKTYVDDTYEL